MTADEIAFKNAQQQWREQRRAGLVAEEGWTTLVGLHWIGPGPHFLGSDTDNGIRLALGPDHLGMLELTADDRLRFVRERGVEVEVDGLPVAGTVWLRADDQPGGPSRLVFDGGKAVATVIRRGGRLALRVRHSEAPARVGFRGLSYWPAEMEWVVPGRFIPHPEGRTMPVANIIGGVDDMPNPGVIEFEHGGRTHRLETIDEGGDALFLVFADHTNGHGSYGAGRFMYVPRPQADGQVQLDFNRAYNPPCAFTAYATCPLPPEQNRLDLAVTAGEKAYAPAAG